ncbi:hypothetical protein N3K66_002261 [Trichothecium roseum]|uniref:Uncharacterized protein n=1 Tax=Trichothecium roseum TaxID=47278 RepID=A0ACC0V9N9_9HYPO|nr:hypothetical protein N3K66_002261 [Trichothecium roseum]
MPFTLELPDRFAFVLATASSTFMVNYLHMFLTVKHRKASGLQYPIAYATQEQAAKSPAAHAFNCAQRAHANFIENQPSFLGALLIYGLKNPTTAAILGATWVIGRIIYAIGYTSGGPQGRVFGSLLSQVGDLSLRCLALYTSINWSLEQL